MIRPTGPFIEARDLVVRRGAREVLAGASIDVQPGEVVALIGPNGAGKSTLLGAIAGDIAISSGSARVGGLDAASSDLVGLARLRAVVRQGTRVVSQLTVLEVVSLGRAPHGDMSSASGIGAAQLALEAVGMEGAANRLAAHLSGGEQQRVHLARALAQVVGPALGGHDGPVRAALLLDEPASALDLAHAVALLDLLRTLAAGGLAILVVLHDLDHASRVADRVGVLQEGRLVAIGSPRDVLQPELLSRVFGVKARVIDAPWADGRPWVGVEGLAEEPRNGTEPGSPC